MRVFVGMETSGTLRRAFHALGCDVISCDLLQSEDGADLITIDAVHFGGGHIVGDVFLVLKTLRELGWWPDLAIFHPDCTYLTNSAEWAYGDGPYHQNVSHETLVGGARREARRQAGETVLRILDLDIDQIVVENPIGALSGILGEADQIYQPYWFGDDASKATCLYLKRAWPIPIDWTKYLPGRKVEWPKGSGRIVERWANQTDSGQNRLTPGEDRWKDRSRTLPKVAAAFAAHFSRGERPPVTLDMFDGIA